jgi:archaellum component FlaC
MPLVEDQTTNIKKDLQGMRERIEKTIGEQFKKIENKIDDRKTEYETKTNDAITKLKENLKTAQNLRETIAKIKESASNLQIFLFLKELKDISLLFSSFTSSISMEFGCFDSIFFTDCP